jgi:hypothetical protein
MSTGRSLTPTGQPLNPNARRRSAVWVVSIGVVALGFLPSGPNVQHVGQFDEVRSVGRRLATFHDLCRRPFAGAGETLESCAHGLTTTLQDLADGRATPSAKAVQRCKISAGALGCLTSWKIIHNLGHDPALRSACPRCGLEVRVSPSTGSRPARSDTGG